MDTGQYVDNQESIRDKADKKVQHFDNYEYIAEWLEINAWSLVFGSNQTFAPISWIFEQDCLRLFGLLHPRPQTSTKWKGYPVVGGK